MSKKRFVFGLILVAAMCGCVELASFAVGRYLERRGVFYRPNPADDYETYVAERHPVLGWPDPGTFGNGPRDASGARSLPAFPDPKGGTLISLYGDSFTWSTEVDDEHAWGNVLAGHVGQRVANFGVSGYGTGQSVLRFLLNTNDSADIVILGHLSENILRNVNQFRDLLYPGEGRGFKPRYILDEADRLELVPLPTFDIPVYPLVVVNPGEYLEHEFFLPGGRSGVRTLDFPWSVSVVRCFGNAHVRAKLAGKPRYAEFYTESHPSGALKLSIEIVARFVDEARRRQKKPLALVFPTTLDVAWFRAHGRWCYEPLVKSLQQRRIDVIDVGAAIAGGPRGAEFERLYANVHFNDEGNVEVARLVHSALVQRGMLP